MHTLSLSLSYRVCTHEPNTKHLALSLSLMASCLLFTRKKREAGIDSRPVGLKTLVDGGIDCPCPSNCVNRNLVASRLVSPSFNYYNKDGDTRQEIEVEVEDEDEEEDNTCWASYGRGHRRKFPPAMSLLARTGNLSCHMPWVLERTYESDGRLVIREVRVKHHEYFRVRRENGRLTLQLVELDENSPLFESGPKHEVDDEDSELSTSFSSLSPSSTSPMSCMTKKDGGGDTTNTTLDFEAMRGKGQGTDGTTKIADLEVLRRKENDDGTDKPSSGFAVSPCLMMLSSSMPEPAFPVGMGKGCFAGDRGSGALTRWCR